MPFDFKKEYKELYMPSKKPTIIEVPKVNYIAVRGKGDPNKEDGEYQLAIKVLYAVSYTLKMSYKTDYQIKGFFDYVVPPLEGFWWQDGVAGYNKSKKEDFCWISVIRLPDFVKENDVKWAIEQVSTKKKIDCSRAEFFTIEEGMCVQIMHIGPFDDEQVSIEIMDKYINEKGFINDFSDKRMHHEIYMSDVRKVVHEKMKTVIRHPIKILI